MRRPDVFVRQYREKQSNEIPKKEYAIIIAHVPVMWLVAPLLPRKVMPPFKIVNHPIPAKNIVRRKITKYSIKDIDRFSGIKIN